MLIVNWNTRDLTVACLDSLERTAETLAHEVVLVDNGSVDGSVAAFAARPRIHLILNEANLGFAAAVNQAYAVARAKYVLLLNSDVELAPGSLQALVRFLDDHDEIAGVAPVYVNPDGSPQPFHFRFPTFAATLANGSKLARRLLPGSERQLRYYKMLDDDFALARPVPQPSASCLLLRRSLLVTGPLMDERYPLYFNDVQLARSIASRGHELWVTPDAVAVHDAHASAKKLPNASRKRQYVASIIRMLSETESAWKVWLYRVVVLAQNAALGIVRSSEALTGRELWSALSGDPGRLPTAPSERPGAPV